MHARSRQRGVSLIEVLVAVLVFSVGLLGVAALMIMAARSNHSAYQRTQATFLADNIADRMRANPVGVWSGYYNTRDFPASASGAASGDYCSNGCTPQELAQADLRAWRRQLTSLLPNDNTTFGRIQCENGMAGYTPTAWASASERGQLAMRPPYGGICTLHITWNERSSDGMVSTFSRMFQP